MISFLKLSLTIQFIEDPQPQLNSQYLDDFFLILFSVLIIAAVMLIPVVISFLMLDHLYKLKKIDDKFDKADCTENSIYSPEQLECNCKKYIKAYRGVCQYLTGIVAWNILSFLYILTGFTDFVTGLKTYFFLPFNSLETIYFEGFTRAFDQYAVNWNYMLAISLFSLLFLSLGKFVGVYFAKLKLKRRNLEFA